MSAPDTGPPLPLDRPGTPPRPFAEPWQAQAFAMTLEAHRAGLFTWDDWAKTLSRGLHAPGAAADGSDYYAIWLDTLEAMIARAKITDPATLAGLAAAWQRAAHATPHGAPILLANDPQAGAQPQN